ncbi:MAG: hypothetical protein WBW94_00325, partial [Anaerolineales bacterium]
MTKSGLADSPFFSVPAKPVLPIPDSEKSVLVRTEVSGKKVKEELRAGKPTSNQESNQASNHASMHALKNAVQANIQEDITPLIRKAVKDIGKESTTYRFTPEEKKALLELTFTYKVQGYKTS